MKKTTKKSVSKKMDVSNTNQSQIWFSILAIVVLIAVLGAIISLNGNFQKKSLSGESTNLPLKENINQNFDESRNITLRLNNQINNMKITGNITGNGEAKVYLKKDFLKFLILDLNDLKEKDIMVEEQPIKQININNQNQKKIDILLNYRNGSSWDKNNDGKEKIDRIIDFSVEDSIFYWNVNQEKLCTKWVIYPEGNDGTAVCYGAKECCNFLGLNPARERWNDVFYLSYGNMAQKKIMK